MPLLLHTQIIQKHYNAAKTLHLGDDYGVKEGNTANFTILNAPDFYKALNEKSSVLYSVHGGKIIYKEEPKKGEVLLDS